MSVIQIPSRKDAPTASQPLLDAVEKKLDIVPNLFRLLALSPAVLEGFLDLNTALGRTLDPKTRSRIALAVAQVNACDYCLSAHSYISLNMTKLDRDEIEQNRRGRSNDERANIAVAFAAKVARDRGNVSDGDIGVLRAVRYSDAEIVEIIAVVAENFFTNLLNTVAGTEIDFPIVRARELD